MLCPRSNESWQRQQDIEEHSSIQQKCAWPGWGLAWRIHGPLSQRRRCQREELAATVAHEQAALPVCDGCCCNEAARLPLPTAEHAATAHGSTAQRLPSLSAVVIAPVVPPSNRAARRCPLPQPRQSPRPSLSGLGSAFPRCAPLRRRRAPGRRVSVPNMGKILDEPRFPVVDNAPDFWKTGACRHEDPPGQGRNVAATPRLAVPPLRGRRLRRRRSRSRACRLSLAVGNFNMSDWGMCAGVTAVCAPVGFYAGGARCRGGAAPGLPRLSALPLLLHLLHKRSHCVLCICRQHYISRCVYPCVWCRATDASLPVAAAHPAPRPATRVSPAAGAQRSPAFAKVSGAMARPSMIAAALMGGLAGFMLAYQVGAASCTLSPISINHNATVVLLSALELPLGCACGHLLEPTASVTTLAAAELQRPPAGPAAQRGGGARQQALNASASPARAGKLSAARRS